MVLSSDRVRDKKVDHVLSRKASIVEARDELVSGVVGFRDEQVRRRFGRVGTAREEAETGAPCTVGHADGTGELNAEEGGVQ